MKKYLVYLHFIGISQAKLLEIFGSKNSNYKDFFESISEKSLSKYNFKSNVLKNILEKYKKIDTKKIDKIIQDLGVQIVCIYDENYPELLKQISNPPYFLYVRGKLGNDNFFSIIGSRKMTNYAIKAGKEIINELSSYFSIVSGGAIGCDALAHRLALDNNAKTVVVLGSGIDQLYPKYNIKLFEEVVEKGGAIISIFPLQTLPNIYTFPIRNEIVSGMSSGLLVLQAGEKSGTLITTNLALEQGRDVFAIPSGIYDGPFIGSNNLIKNGNAKFTISAKDILEEYNYKTITLKKEDIVFQDDTQKDIYNILKNNLSLGVDDLIEKTGFEYQKLILSLSMMEISGFIKKDEFGNYSVV